MENIMVNSIPYVDTKQLLTGKISPDAFINLLHEYGFAYLYNLDFQPLNLTSQQFKKLEACAQNFFNLPLENKEKYYIGRSPNHRGYVPVTEQGNYGDFDACTKYPPAQLRLLHYLPSSTLIEKEDVAMGGHTDYECFTLLYQSSPGLQGYINSQSRFMNLPVFKNTLLMVMGDMMHFMTNGYLKSFYHRVINNGTERFSFPFFMNLDFETEIKVLPKFQAYKTNKDATKQKLPEKLVVGHHLLDQLYRDFPYLKRKIDQGELKLPFIASGVNQFENKNLIDQLNI